MSDKAFLERLRARAQAEVEERKRRGVWGGSVRAHVEYQKRPIEWIVEKLGVPENTIRWSMNPGYEKHKWDGTTDPLVVMLTALADSRDCGVEAATGTQKTYTAACATLWFLACHEDAIVEQWATTEKQLLLNMWKEIGALWPHFKKHFPDAQLLTGKIRMRPASEDGKETWAATAKVAGVGAEELSATKAQGSHCLADDHEILTRRGWLGINDVTTDDHCLSVPIDGEVAEWMPITAVYRYERDAPLNVYDGRFVSFAVTDEHRFPTKYHRGVIPWHMAPLSAMKQQFVVRRVTGWFGEPFAVPDEFRELGFDAHQFAAFVGFWIGDGGTRMNAKRGKYYEVLLYQTKERGRRYIEALLAGIKLNRARDYYSFSNEGVVRWLMTHVGQYGRHRRIPDMLRNAPPEILDSLLEGLWQAEGSFDAKGRRRLFYNTSPRLMDDVQEVLIKLGRASAIGVNREAGYHNYIHGQASLSKHTCYVMSYPERNVDHIVKTKAIHKENIGTHVWCISTPYESFYTRRNGRAFLSGNSEHLLIITEETPGINPAIMAALDMTRTGDHNIHLAIGNPDHRGDPLHKFCEREQVVAIRISALDHPNIVSGLPIIPAAIGPRRLEERTAEYGKGNRLYLSRIRGISPAESADALIRWEWCVAAAERWSDLDLRDGPLALGADVAWSENGDKSAISRWQGKCCTEVVSQRCADPNEFGRQLAKEIMDPENPIDPRYVGIDPIGGGSGTVNELRSLKIKVRHLGGGTRAVPGIDKDELWSTTEVDLEGNIRPSGRVVVQAERFNNLRSQILWMMREDLRLGRIALPNDEELFSDLTTAEYETKNGVICVEKKEEIIKRLKHSPDKGDACVYGNAVRCRVPQLPRRKKAGSRKPRRQGEREFGLEQLVAQREKDERARRKEILRSLRSLARR